MFQRRLGWIGVDIGSRTVKIAQVERDASGALRLRQGVVIGRRTPWFNTDSGMGSPPGTSSLEVVAALTHGDRFTGGHAACALPMHLYGFRALHIPQGTVDERRNMLSGMLHEMWDECGDACEFDFWETDMPGGRFRQDEANVHVLAVSRRWTNQVTQDTAQAELTLQVLDGPPLAIARAVHLGTPAATQSPAAAIEWGFTSTTFCVALNGRALYTRRIRSCGLRLVCDSIQSSLGVSLEESQHLLLAYGLPAGDPDPARHSLQRILHNAASEHLEHLAEEIRRTLTYFHAQRRELIPERIWLMGGGASIRNAAAWLSRACEAPVDAWQLPSSDQTPAISAGRRGGTRQAMPSAPMLAVAIALSSLPLERKAA